MSDLTAERDTAEANLERLQNKFEAVTAENAELKSYTEEEGERSEKQAKICIDLQARVKELDAELQTATFIIRGLYSGPHTNISLAKAKKWLAEKDDE
jgi:hypothetical protein